jgi:Xaa-Pro aminopeptidase
MRFLKLTALAVSGLMVLSFSASTMAQDHPLGMEDRAKIRDAWLMDRLENVVPALMEREGIDAWVLIAREYNEDPVVKTMLPATWLGARRRMVLMFLNHGGERGVERIAASRYDVGEYFKGSWNPEETPNQWDRVRDILVKFNPTKIGLNISEDWQHADGLTYNEHTRFVGAIGPKLASRIVSAEKVAVGWLETRTAMEMKVYPEIMAEAKAIIAEGFSNKVIVPGKTTTNDIVWWFRDRIRAQGYITWFHPSVDIQRSKADHKKYGTTAANPGPIQPGDVIHCDFGITYLGLNTDTQQMGYVLRPDERDVPAGIKKALLNGNKVQDALTRNIKTGRTGNEILAQALKEAREEGLRPSIYTHPIGFHGHAAGTTIGMWDKQGGVPGDGDYPMHPNTAYSIELSSTSTVPEWDGNDLRIALEEDGFYTGSSFRYINKRQTKYHLIKSK